MTALDGPGFGWTLADWRQAYAEGRLEPETLLAWVARFPDGDSAWIARADAGRLRAQLKQLEAAARGGREHLPLFGIPFAVKDNIDVAGWPTTAACPAFTKHATDNACIVERLVRAGAIVVGKTNMDQFATGLVGTRSPYGVVRNPFDTEYIGGGSSSGSASVVARGLVPFALGTDTAGSGRVPAAFTNIVGLKPTRGALSTTGIVPACRTLDCASVFALCVDDAELIAKVAGGFDPADPYSRRHQGDGVSTVRKRFAVPEPLQFFGDQHAERAFQRTLDVLLADGATIQSVDFTPFSELARLLYEGPWVAERYHVVESLLDTQPGSVHPVVRSIIERGGSPSALDAFRAEYRRAALSRVIHDTLAPFDALLVPTTPTIYRVSEVEAEPFETNARLGTYTNFTNLADLCGLALPGVFRDDGLPAGITLLAPAWRDAQLGALGRWIQAQLGIPLGAALRPSTAKPAQPSALMGPTPTNPAPTTKAAGSSNVLLAVVGAHMRGMPLNHELTDLGARFVEPALTAVDYRLYSLRGTAPPKPGLIRSPSGGHVALEVWELSVAAFGLFVSRIPSPLGIGRIQLSDGRSVQGFVCEAWALEGAEDITQYGGFRAYLDSKS